MALKSGSQEWNLTGTSITVKFSWSQESTDYDTNTSTVRYTLTTLATSSGFPSGGDALCAVIAQSRTLAQQDGISLVRGAGSSPIFSGSTTINHNTDGSCSLTWRIYIGCGQLWSNSVVPTFDKSFTVTLEAVDRYATITAASNFTDEENPTITYYNPMGSSIGTLQAAIGVSTSSGVVYPVSYRNISKAVNGSYTFNLTNTERNALLGKATTSNSLNVIFYVKSIINGVTYIKTTNKTMSVVNALPQIVFSLSDVDTTTRELTGDSSNTAISGYSDMRVTVTPAAQKLATISSIQVTQGGRTYTQEIGGYVTFYNVKTSDISIVVTDSRGNSNSVSTTFDLIPYTPLTCQVEVDSVAFPSDETATSLFKISGVYYNKNLGLTSKASPNSFRGSYRYKIDDGSYTSWISMSPTKTETSFTQYVSVTANYNSSIELEVNVSDSLVSVIQTFTSKPTPVFDWGEDDFNFNVPVTIQGATVDAIVEQGTSGIWTYRKYASGIAECWGKQGLVVSVNSAWGSLYTSGKIYSSEQTYPFEFTQVPTISVTIGAGYAGGWVMASGDSSTPTNIKTTGTYEICRATAYTGGQYTLNYFVRGYWK